MTVYNPIYSKPLIAKKSGISPSYHSHIMHKIGSETSLDILNALEADKVFFVEGVDDGEYIRKIMEINGINLDCVFWAFDGLDNLISRIKHYKVFFDGIGNGANDLWNKCSIVIDADFTTVSQKQILKTALESRTGLPVFLWNTYTLESSILKDKNALTDLILATATFKSIILSKNDVSDAVDKYYAKYIIEKTSEMDDTEEFCNRVQGQIDARRSNLTNSLDIKKVYTGFNLSNSYRVFCKRLFASGEIDHICNKDDVEKILTDIFNELSIPVDSTIQNRLYEIIQVVNLSNQPIEWKNLADFIS